MIKKKYVQNVYQIIKTQKLTSSVYDLHILAPDIAQNAVPGQFVHIKAPGHFLRRPISICQIDPQSDRVRLVFEVRGQGTKALAESLVHGSIDVLGPLGHGFTLLDPAEKAIIVGGGIGTPPLLALSDHYGMHATTILGFRSADAVILEQDFKAYHNCVTICTDDGSAGQRGLVTEPLKACLQTQKPAMIYACGPMPMLRATAMLAREFDVRCELSLEEKMACGVGACLGCACQIQNGPNQQYFHVCRAGPVFRAEQVVFE